MKKGKLYKLLSTISITGIFVIATIFVASLFDIIKIGYVFIEILGILAIIDMSCLFSLPWAKRIEEKSYKVTAIVFLVFIGICAILASISFLLLANTIKNNSELSSGLWLLVKSSLIIVAQLLTSSTIAYSILKYKKQMIPFQVITYISNLFVDFYFTCLCFGLTMKENELNFTDSLSEFLFTKTMYFLLVLFLVYIIISSIVIKNVDKRKIKELIKSNEKDSSPVIGGIPQNLKGEQEIEGKLAKLKTLLERNLISQEEYEEKKKDVLKDL